MPPAPDAQQLYRDAVGLYQSGKLLEAESVCRRILAQNPDDAPTLQLIALLTHRAGHPDQAIQYLQRAVAISPGAADAHLNLGVMLAAARRWQEAIRSFSKSAELAPNLPEAHNNLGKALRETGQADAAIDAFRRATAHRPNYVDAWNNLGLALHAARRFTEAADAFRAAIAARPEFVEAHNNLGIALVASGRFEEALAAYRAATTLRSDAAVYNNLAAALLSMGRTDEALAAIDQSIRLRPADADTLYLVGNARRSKGDLDAAGDAYREALRLRPDFADALANLGTVLRDSGKLDEAIACYRRATELTPAPWPASSLVYTLYFHPEYGPQQLLEEHRAWDRRYAQPLEVSRTEYPNARDPQKRLRIGYVSPDFRAHCQSNFTIPLLAHHDRATFEIVCYSSVAIPDDTTARIKTHADVWRDVAHLDDQQLADLIAQDRIDVLVDLAMHMDKNRLLVFARRPAPVQVTWLAYPGTTGLSAIDYRLSDPQLDPEGSAAFYTERTVRLPETFWCYDPLTDGPQVSELPALSNGYFTFGCLNNFCKITAPTLDLWSQVLAALPTSRLVVLTPAGSARQALLDGLRARGIASERIEPMDRLPRAEYLAAYNRFDLCLDTFPYTGHTTTLDSLWMGVPPITLAGATAVSRGGLSLLTNVGLTEFVARSPADFVRIATTLGAELPRLAEIRRTLRDKMQFSPLMNTHRFARNVESVYRRTWGDFCSSAC